MSRLVPVSGPLVDQNFLEDRIMNLYSESRSSTRFYVVGMVIAAMLLCASISPAFGQERSTDRNNPTLLTSNDVNDDLDGSGDQYFYKFSVVPGKLTVKFMVKASDTNAGATLDLFDTNSRAILSDVLAQGADGGFGLVEKSIQISARRDIVMRIKGIKYGDSGGKGTYKVVLDGAVNFGQGAAPNGGGAAAPVGGGAAAPAGPNLWALMAATKWSGSLLLSLKLRTSSSSSKE